MFFIISWKDERPCWTEINDAYGEQCGNFLALIDLLLALPAASAEAERGFSTMKRIKSDWRSRLGEAHVSDLMTVQLEAPDVSQYDPMKAIELWNTRGLRSRRPQLLDDTITMLPEDNGDSDDEIKNEDEAWDELDSADVS